MLTDASLTNPQQFTARGRHAQGSSATESHQHASQQVAQTLKRLADELTPKRQVMHAGDLLYRAGGAFTQLHILNSGFAKIVCPAPDGREQLVGLRFRGDWLGFDGIAAGRYSCDAVVMDTAEVWTVQYDALLASCAQEPWLMATLHQAMGYEIVRDRDSLMSVCTLPADARVADFLHHWAVSLARRGLRHDQISLRMTRAEIGSYLGMTLETVSRALSRLAREGVIGFAGAGRREICIPELEPLSAFVQRNLAPAGAVLQ